MEFEATVSRSIEAISSDLTPRAPQRGFQSLLLLFPAGIFGSRFLLEGLQFGLDGRGPLCMLRSALSNAACALSTACCRRSRSFCLAASSLARSRSRRFCSRS